MNPLLRRILIRSLTVAAILAVIGYGYAYVLLMVLQQNAEPRPEHASVMWRVPLSLAGAGVIVIVVSECLLALFRRRKPADPDRTGPR